MPKTSQSLSKRLAPHFGQELFAAGLNNDISFTEDGLLYGYEKLSAAKQAAIDALVEAHNPDSPPPPSRVMFLQFVEMFTPAEQDALVDATMKSKELKLWYDKAVGAEFINLRDPRTVAGFNKLVQLGLVTRERADRILAGREPEHSTPIPPPAPQAAPKAGRKPKETKK